MEKARIVVSGFKDNNCYDLRETCALVTRFPLICTVLAYADKHGFAMRQLDVNVAFLNSEVMEEINMKIPDGMKCTDVQKKGCVLRSLKSLYGLKTSPNRWYELFSGKMEELDFTPKDNDRCLFAYVIGNIIVLAILYVDDIIMASNCSDQLNEFKEKIVAEIEMKDSGGPDEYQGIELIRDIKFKTLKLNQTRSTEKMLKCFGYETINPKLAPMSINLMEHRKRRMRGIKKFSDKAMDKTKYREAASSLLYLANANKHFE